MLLDECVLLQKVYDKYKVLMSEVFEVCVVAPGGILRVAKGSHVKKPEIKINVDQVQLL